MWWRNLKITGKLLVGFGVLLAMFAGAVGTVWFSLSSALSNTVFMSDGVVPVLVNAMDVERSIYDLFLAVDSARLTGSEAALKAIKDDQVVVDKNVQSLLDLGKTNDKLQAPKMLEHNVMPLLQQYSGIIGRVEDVVRRKSDAMARLRTTASTLSESAEKLITSFYSSSIEELEASRSLGKLDSDDEVDKVKRRLGQLYAAGRIMRDVEKLRRDVYFSLYNRDVDGFKTLLENTDKIRDEIQTLNESMLDPKRKELAARMLDDCNKFDQSMEEFAVIFADDDVAAHDTEPAQKALNDSTSALSRLGTSRADEISSENEAAVLGVIRLLLSVTAACIVIGVLIAFLIARGISKPLSAIVGLAKRAEGGDLTVGEDDFTYRGRDEMGSLVEAMFNMIAAQNSALVEVIAVSDDLTGGAATLAALAERSNSAMSSIKASVEQVSKLSENNGAALQECNAGVEEMSAGADTVAQSATDGASFISQTTDVSAKAIQTVDGVIAGMRDVDRNAKQTEGKTRQLMSAVENVSGFVSVITGIADQTNLLALNAAIEAARAGEVGRGFAVVAEEVRKLAEESARAAQNVNGIIGELQNGARDSIDAMTEASRLLGGTLSQAEDAQKQLDAAMKEINKANDSIQNIAAVAEEQAASSKEVASGIDSATKATMEMVSAVSGIGAATDDTAASARSVAEQAEAINGHVEHLTNVLAHFKIKESASAAPKPGRKALAAVIA
ncbi:MAG: methyl-accepting chemotaxis protein [Synergistaceae bacterium]|jgi:methyl-accepting chemotaxis protein|nr:methyl-accepting chemotaxis protein [Synergistaceae bacterium]